MKSSFPSIEPGNYVDISIPLRFQGEQPNVYGVDPAKSTPCEYGDLIGDTREGGSVNFEQYTFIPHCNGTHTECVGHITDERISVRNCLKDVMINSVLVTVEPENAIESGEKYPFELESTDIFVTKSALQNALSDHRPRSTKYSDALIIRTLPNDNTKLSRRYDRPVPPFFSNDATEFIVRKGFSHLLVDLPSIDRLYDAGKLSNHRLFWNVEFESKEINDKSRVDATITELVYVPNEVEDGAYGLNLQIAPFESDTAPSRPLLFD